MTCIKTGADVYLPEHGCTVHGDLFRVGDTYILHCGSQWAQCCDYKPERANLMMHEFSQCGSPVIAAATWECSQFSYEGFEL